MAAMVRVLRPGGLAPGVGIETLEDELVHAVVDGEGFQQDVTNLSFVYSLLHGNSAKPRVTLAYSLFNHGAPQRYLAWKNASICSPTATGLSR